MILSLKRQALFEVLVEVDDDFDIENDSQELVIDRWEDFLVTEHTLVDEVVTDQPPDARFCRAEVAAGFPLQVRYLGQLERVIRQHLLRQFFDLG